MKLRKLLCFMVLFLCGCSNNDQLMDRAMQLRAKMIAGEVRFSATVTADYGEKRHTFSMDCQADTLGNVTFVVTEPESIAGITGTVGANGGKLTFDDQALAFDLMADGQVSPVSAPWVLIRTLRGGYLTSCNKEAEQLRLAIDDSYEEDALHLDIWLNEEDYPKLAEIYWQGRRLMTIQIENFMIV